MKQPCRQGQESYSITVFGHFLTLSDGSRWKRWTLNTQVINVDYQYLISLLSNTLQYQISLIIL